MVCRCDGSLELPQQIAQIAWEMALSKISFWNSTVCFGGWFPHDSRAGTFNLMSWHMTQDGALDIIVRRTVALQWEWLLRCESVTRRPSKRMKEEALHSDALKEQEEDISRYCCWGVTVDVRDCAIGFPSTILSFAFSHVSFRWCRWNIPILLKLGLNVCKIYNIWWYDNHLISNPGSGVGRAADLRWLHRPVRSRPLWGAFGESTWSKSWIRWSGEDR